jgi:hypothetical protein
MNRDDTSSKTTTRIVNFNEEQDIITLFLNLAHDTIHDFNLSSMSERIYKNLHAIRNIVIDEPNKKDQDKSYTLTGTLKTDDKKVIIDRLTRFFNTLDDEEGEGEGEESSKQKVSSKKTTRDKKNIEPKKEAVKKRKSKIDKEVEVRDDYNPSELNASIVNVSTILTSYLGTTINDETEAPLVEDLSSKQASKKREREISDEVNDFEPKIKEPKIEQPQPQEQEAQPLEEQPQEMEVTDEAQEEQPLESEVTEEAQEMEVTEEPQSFSLKETFKNTLSSIKDCFFSFVNTYKKYLGYNNSSQGYTGGNIINKDNLKQCLIDIELALNDNDEYLPYNADITNDDAEGVFVMYYFIKYDIHIDINDAIFNDIFNDGELDIKIKPQIEQIKQIKQQIQQINQIMPHELPHCVPDFFEQIKIKFVLNDIKILFSLYNEYYKFLKKVVESKLVYDLLVCYEKCFKNLDLYDQITNDNVLSKIVEDSFCNNVASELLYNIIIYDDEIEDINEYVISDITGERVDKLPEKKVSNVGDIAEGVVIPEQNTKFSQQESQDVTDNEFNSQSEQNTEISQQESQDVTDNEFNSQSDNESIIPPQIKPSVNKKNLFYHNASQFINTGKIGGAPTKKGEIQNAIINGQKIKFKVIPVEKSGTFKISLQIEKGIIIYHNYLMSTIVRGMILKSGAYDYVLQKQDITQSQNYNDETIRRNIENYLSTTRPDGNNISDDIFRLQLKILVNVFKKESIGGDTEDRELIGGYNDILINYKYKNKDLLSVPQWINEVTRDIKIANQRYTINNAARIKKNPLINKKENYPKGWLQNPILKKLFFEDDTLSNSVFCPQTSIMDAMGSCSYTSKTRTQEFGSMEFSIQDKEGINSYGGTVTWKSGKQLVNISLSLVRNKKQQIIVNTDVSLTNPSSPLKAIDAYRKTCITLQDIFKKRIDENKNTKIKIKDLWEGVKYNYFYDNPESPQNRNNNQSSSQNWNKLCGAMLVKSCGDFLQEINGVLKFGGYVDEASNNVIKEYNGRIVKYDTGGDAFRLSLQGDRPSGFRSMFIQQQGQQQQQGNPDGINAKSEINAKSITGYYGNVEKNGGYSKSLLTYKGGIFYISPHGFGKDGKKGGKLTKKHKRIKNNTKTKKANQKNNLNKTHTRRKRMKRKKNTIKQL